MNSSENKPKPVIFNSEKEMPYFDICSATMEWNETGSWRYLRPTYVEKIPACQASCPTGNDIERWIRFMEKGEVEKAWQAATLENPFPAIMGRVCFHPCMEGCNRCEMGGAVNINMLERALGDAIGNKIPTPEPFAAKSGKRVAVIGAGPAGLAFAYHATRLGHKVTVYDREKMAGGMLRYGIPSYRLPREIIDREIDSLKRMGIEFKLGNEVKDAAHLEEIVREYDAAFVATGAHRSRPMGVSDEKSEGVTSGLNFLKSIEHSKKINIGSKVLVVGGGNTAIDAARSAKRLGAEVTVLYRRSVAEMPASQEEIQAAIDEGVRIEILMAPKRVIVKSGKATGLECQRMKLGDPDESGRRRPVPIEGSEIVFEADAIFSAIGEEIENRIIPAAIHIEGGSLASDEFGKTSLKGMFAGGDITAGSRTVVDALGDGKRSAIAIDCILRGENPADIIPRITIPGTSTPLISKYLEHRTGSAHAAPTDSKTEMLSEVVRFADLNSAYFTHSTPAEKPSLPLEKRFSGDPFAEVHTSPSDDLKASELSRCFHCGRCTECDNCYIYCPDLAIAKKGSGFEIDLYYCKGCGLCSHECPRAAMRMTEEPTEF